MKYTCPCCGYNTFDEPVKGTYDICELCGWEDDLVQNGDPDYEGGANEICLREAQLEFLKEAFDTTGYIKEPGWKLLDPSSKEPQLKSYKTDFIVTSNGEVKNA